MEIAFQIKRAEAAEARVRRAEQEIERLTKVASFIARLRPIAPGEEITYDYGREYFNLFIKNSGCRCAACLTKSAAVCHGKRTAISCAIAGKLARRDAREG